jgi:hypothetical protein
MRISAKFIADKPKNIRKSLVELLIILSIKLSIAPNSIKISPEASITFFIHKDLSENTINIRITDVILIVIHIGTGILKAIP